MTQDEKPQPDAAPARAGLRQRFMSAARWTMIGYALAQVLRLGSNLLLTRLLAPEYFGAMALANVVIIGLWMFSDVGLQQVGIRSARGEEPEFLNVIWVSQIARGFILTLAGLLVAVCIHFAAQWGWFPRNSVYADPIVPPLIAFVSLYGIISGFDSTKVAWARRTLSMGRLTQIELVNQLGTTLFIIVWALISPSIWALAAGWLFGGMLKMILTHVALQGPRNALHWDRTAFSEVWNFGKWVFVSSSLSFLVSSGDRLLLGLFATSADMGLYSIAFMLVNTVQAAVSRLISTVALPAFSELLRERPQELMPTYYRVRKPLDYACLISAGLLMTMSGSIVDLLYPNRYAGVAWMLAWLSLTLVTTRFEIFDQCLVALGHVKQLSRLNLVRLAVLYTMVPAGYAIAGIRGAVAGVALAGLLSSLVSLVIQKRLGLLAVRREMMAIPIFAAGVLIGWPANWALGQLTQLWRSL